MTFRCGYVALIGRPNTGKSTLINRLVGESLAIVTPKAQTTRQRIVGLVHRPAAQLILVDTPGFHASPKALNQAMLRHVERALGDANVCCLLLEPHLPLNPIDVGLWQRIGTRPGCHRIPILNKFDTVPLRRAQSLLKGFAVGLGTEAVAISALHGTGVGTLVDRCESLLPEGPPLYPDDIYTEQPTQFLAAEMVREEATLALGQELPYALAVEIEAFEDREELTRIAAAIIVEKESQKGIVIGAGGRMIKRIGSAARKKIEALLGRQVYLDLRVRVEPGWTKDPAALRRLGYL